MIRTMNVPTFPSPAPKNISLQENCVSINRRIGTTKRRERSASWLVGRKRKRARSFQNQNVKPQVAIRRYVREIEKTMAEDKIIQHDNNYKLQNLRYFSITFITFFYLLSTLYRPNLNYKKKQKIKP